MGETDQQPGYRQCAKGSDGNLYPEREANGPGQEYSRTDQEIMDHVYSETAFGKVLEDGFVLLVIDLYLLADHEYRDDHQDHIEGVEGPEQLGHRFSAVRL